MNAIRAAIQRFLSGAEAATMLEYGLVLLLIAVICISAVSFIGTSIVLPMYSSIIPGL
jgi:Flp pilus assembly pilin Flp